VDLFLNVMHFGSYTHDIVRETTNNIALFADGRELLELEHD